MSIAVRSNVWRAGLATTTVRQFGVAVGFALAAIAVGCVLYLVETCLFQAERRFIENPGSLMMRACGLAHFWIGWLFLFTSPRLRNRGAVLQLLFLTLVGAALCWVCAQIGSLHHPFMFLFFYSYFLIHEIRDETKLYQIYGGVGNEAQRGQAFVQALSRSVTLLVMGLIGGGYLLYGLAVKKHPLLVTIAPPIYWLGIVIYAGGAAALGRRTWLLAQQHYGSLREALAAHAPLVLVYAGLVSILILGLGFGAASFNLIIIIHAGAWLAFTCYQLGNRPASLSRNPWTWMRCTPVGFLVLHLSVIALLVALMALRVHVWERTGLICDMLEVKSFPYWSLMHISMAFWRPR